MTPVSIFNHIIGPVMRGPSSSHYAAALRIGRLSGLRRCRVEHGRRRAWHRHGLGPLLDASWKIGQRWKLVTYTPDDAGFVQATAMLKRELDAGRPVIVDFKYIGPQYPNGSAGHTLNVCGCIAEEELYILCNSAVATPGLRLINAADLKNFWRSDHYGAQSNGVLSRPAYIIDRP
jgi:hypothetical protein